MADLVWLVPVLKRPGNVKPLLDSIKATTPEARVLFLTDPDDMPERQAIASFGAEELSCGGNYAQKIRKGVEATREPFLFLGADDLKPHAGWFEAANRKLSEGFQVVGVNDLRPRRRIHATHFLITRKYANQPTIDGGPGPFHEGYFHSFVDDELIATAQHRGVYAFAPDAVVEHLHFLEEKAPMDTTYEKGLEAFRQDRRYFRSREPLWMSR